MKNTKMTQANKIKIGLIFILLIVLTYMIKVTFFISSNGTTITKVDKPTPSAPIEIDAQEYFKDNNNSIDTNSSSYQSVGGQKSIDKIFSSLIPSQLNSVPPQVSTSQKSPPFPMVSNFPPPQPNFINSPQLPSLRATTGGGSQTFNGIPPIAGLNSHNQEVLPQIISIYGVNCINNECEATTSIGTVKKGDNLVGNEKVEFVGMSGIKTNKRMITY